MRVIVLLMFMMASPLMAHQSVSGDQCTDYEIHGKWTVFDDGHGTNVGLAPGDWLSIKYKENNPNKKYALKLNSQNWDLVKNDTDYLCDPVRNVVVVQVSIESKESDEQKSLCISRVKDTRDLATRPGSQRPKIDQVSIEEGDICSGVGIVNPGHSHADR